MCLAFVVFILAIMLMTPGIQKSVYAIPIWLAFMWVCYFFKSKREARENLSAVSSLNN